MKQTILFSFVIETSGKQNVFILMVHYSFCFFLPFRVLVKGPTCRVIKTRLKCSGRTTENWRTSVIMMIIMFLNQKVVSNLWQDVNNMCVCLPTDTDEVSPDQVKHDEPCWFTCSDCDQPVIQTVFVEDPANRLPAFHKQNIWKTVSNGCF